MDFNERISILAGIAQRHPDIGKTAIMKCAYFLQELKKVPLDYNFEIYTYGPYSSEVMEELDYARQTGLLDVRFITYSSGMHGYQISSLQDITTPFDKQIDEVVQVFGAKTAKELELLSTILFVQKNYYKNRWGRDKDLVCNSVKEIKPRFSEDEISNGYDFMKSCIC